MGLKIKKIRIEGMHNVVDKTYEFNDFVYLFGKNGAGKSTVLQAVQLALLGYIPGYPKTNEGIFKHARSKMMAVTLTLSDEATDYEICRTWSKPAQTVTSTTNVKGILDLEHIIGNIELPVFNFSEFTNLSANKLKEWFISFLPNDGDEIEWGSTLSDALGTMHLIDGELISQTAGEIARLKRPGLDGAEFVKEVNTMLKDKQQYTKGEIDSLNKTIQSMVYYHDVPDEDEEPITAKIAELEAAKIAVVKYNEALARRNSVSMQLANIEVGASSYQADPEVPRLAKVKLEADEKVTALKEQLTPLEEEAKAVAAEGIKAQALADATGLCPYTKEECETAKAKISEAKAAYDEATSKYAELNVNINNIKKDIQAAEAVSREAYQRDSELRVKYSKSEALQSMLTDLPEDPGKTLEEIEAELASLRQTLSKLQINKKYNSVINQFTSKKYQYENTLEALKVWVKLTGPNGLQTKLMTEPFNNLAEDMNKYLTDMFQEETTCNFNLSEKANSFSFGLMRGENYITFDTLSSGEKCLYTIALLACILDRTSTALKVLIIDDLVDHLDDANAEFTFKSLMNVKDIQIIMAGVKPCTIDSIRVDV